MKNKSEKVQMTIQNEISSKEVEIGSNLISQTIVKKTLVSDVLYSNQTWNVSRRLVLKVKFFC